MKNSRYLVYSQILMITVSMLSQIIIARYLLPEGRGVYALGVVFGAFSLLFTNFGNEYGIRYLLLKGDIDIKEAAGYLLFILGAVMLIVILGLYFFVYLLGNSTAITTGVLFGSVVFTIFTFSTKQLNVFLTVTKNFKEASFYTVGEEICKLCFLFIALNIFGSVESAFWSSSVASLLIIFFYTARIKPKLKLSNEFYLRLKYIYSYGLKNFFFTLTNLGSGHLAILIISMFYSNSEVGLFSVAYGLVSRLQIIPDTLNRILVPLSKESSPHLNLRLAISSLFYLGLVCIAVVFTLGDFIIELLFSNLYLTSSFIMKILIIGFIAKVMVKPIEAFYNEVSGRPVLPSIINFISFLCMGLFMLLEQGKTGIMGSTAIISVFFVLNFIVTLFLYKRESNFALWQYFVPHFLNFKKS